MSFLKKKRFVTPSDSQHKYTFGSIKLSMISSVENGRVGICLGFVKLLLSSFIECCPSRFELLQLKNNIVKMQKPVKKIDCRNKFFGLRYFCLKVNLIIVCRLVKNCTQRSRGYSCSGLVFRPLSHENKSSRNNRTFKLPVKPL